MENAKKEMIELLENKEIKCASIKKGDWFYEENEKTKITLKINHSKEDLEDFLTKLDFEYDGGFGTQELFGIVWFKDNSWADRHEYDGSEYWEHQSIPNIPKEISV